MTPDNPMENNAKLYELIRSVAFEKLSEQEKSFVLSQLTQEEYQHLHLLENQLQQYPYAKEDLPKLNPTIQHYLLQSFRQHNKKTDSFKTSIESLFLYRIPAYYFIAILLITCSIIAYLLRLEEVKQIATVDRIIYKTRVDTVVVENEKYVYKMKHIYVHIPDTHQYVRIFTNGMEGKRAIDKIGLPDSTYNIGMSMENDTLLRMILTSIKK